MWVEIENIFLNSSNFYLKILAQRKPLARAMRIEWGQCHQKNRQQLFYLTEATSVWRSLSTTALRRHKKRWEARGRLETRLQFTGNSFRLHVEIHGNNPVKEEIKSHVYANDTIWYLFVQVYIWVLIIKRFPALLILKNRFAAINWESPVMFIKLTLTDEATRRKAANDFIMS